jgi:ethanolamine utilization cobalamin adenosyltransferase
LRIITEIELRDLYKKEPFETYKLPPSVKITPAGRQFLNDRRIKIIEQDSKECKKEGYLILDTGEMIKEKPEEMTHTKGNSLVLKNDNRIKFRGKIDSFEAILIKTITTFRDEGYLGLADDLIIIFEYTKRLLRAEVLDEPLPFIDYKGLTQDEIREYSHHPEKYLGVKHFVPDPKYGWAMADINILRTKARELEIAGIDAFYNGEKREVEREDIILALNRISSILYIIMCKYLKGDYDL